MDINKFTDKAKQVLMATREVMRRYQQSQMDVDDLLLALLDSSDGLANRILERAGGNVAAIKREVESLLARGPKVQVSGDTGQVYLTPNLGEILDKTAWEQAQRLHDTMIAVEHLLLAILAQGKSEAARILQSGGVTLDAVDRALVDIRGGHQVTDEGAENRYQALEKYSRDLTQLAREDKLDPVIGRDTEIRARHPNPQPPHQE